MMSTRIRALGRRVVPARMHPALFDAYVRLRYLVLSPLYRGDTFECPFCRGRFGRLLITGQPAAVWQEKGVPEAGPRKSLCPRCLSIARERSMFEYLRRYTDIFTARRTVLHIAAERNLRKVLGRQQNLRYVTADLQDPASDIFLDLTCLPFRSESFDVVICSHVLEHVRNDRLAMAEIYRILRSGGWAILQAPIAQLLDRTDEDESVILPSERFRRFGQEDHVRLYGRDFRERVSAAGFRVDEVMLRDRLAGEADLLALAREPLNVCWK